MNKAVIFCLVATIVTAIAGLNNVESKEAQARYHKAHNEVERLAFGLNGSDELRKAVTLERSADKDLFIQRSFARWFITASIGFSVTALLFTVFGTKPQT